MQAIAAPPEVVFDVIADPYLVAVSRRPAGLGRGRERLIGLSPGVALKPGRMRADPLKREVLGLRRTLGIGHDHGWPEPAIARPARKLAADVMALLERETVWGTRVEWVADADRFADLEPEWDDLAEGTGLPFLRHAWISAWWTAFGAGRTLSICTVRDGDELVAALPLCRGKSGLEPLANAHTPAFEPLARDDDALRALIATVLSAAPALTMPRVPVGSPVLDVLKQQSEGRLLLVEPGDASPTVDTEGALSAYWDGLSGKARSDFRRRRRLLARLDGVEQKILAEPEDLGAELAYGFAIEGSGWKSRRGTAILDSPETTVFFREVAAGFARLGKLRLSTIEVEGQMAAFSLNLLDHDRVWGLKTGYDVAYARYAPGILLVLAQIERCFELGLSSHELLGDAAPWKRKLTPKTRAHWMVGSYARKPQPLLRYGFRRYIRPQARRAYRQLEPRMPAALGAAARRACHVG